MGKNRIRIKNKTEEHRHNWINQLYKIQIKEHRNRFYNIKKMALNIKKISEKIVLMLELA